MKLTALARYPIKGMAGEALPNAHLKCGQGVPGDRRFAFGVDASKDDGVWHSSANYLINSRRDNLLKFAPQRNESTWTITGPSGEVLSFDANDPRSIERFNQDIGPFLKSVKDDGTPPRLIDRNPKNSPKGHWDFVDSEVLIINLATLRALEQHWGIDIDPRRFRANLLIDDAPAWSEFGLYGAELSLGDAKIEILRPARRCAALSVNPTTGERDIALQNNLVKDFGHGFFGVYGRVSQSGEVQIGDSVEQSGTDAVPVQQMGCDIAPSVTLWPKRAVVKTAKLPNTYDISPVGSLPLLDPGDRSRMKLHLGPKMTIEASVQSISGSTVTLHVPEADTMNRVKDGSVLVTGPYADR